MSGDQQPDWYIFHGIADQDAADAQPTPVLDLPPAPPWRDFSNPERRRQRGRTFRARPDDIRMVNAALYLRRPLLITGLPGTGKSSLAYAVAEELGLGAVLEWSITSRAKLQDGLYEYDAIGRLQDSDFSPGGKKDPPPIEDYIVLGPLGSAFADSQPNRPRVLLIDEIDKSDIDLPNDLLNIFEEGEFEIPELVRHASQAKRKAKTGDDPEAVWKPKVRLSRARSATSDVEEAAQEENSEPIDQRVAVPDGKVSCAEFPFVILTSNGERELPPAFLRRCLRLDIKPPDKAHFRRIVRAHFTELAALDTLPPQVEAYITELDQRYKEKKEYIPTDQLLNAIQMVLNEVELEEETLAEGQSKLRDQIMRTIGT